MPGNVSLGAVVILAGGASRRMGVDKLALKRDGITLLQAVVDELTRALTDIGRARANAQPGATESSHGHDCDVPVIIVGPSRAEVVRAPNVVFTLEDPPASGPLAALAAGIGGIGHVPDADVVLVFAADAPRGPAAAHALLDALAREPGSIDAMMLIDERGRHQPLCAAYRLGPLREALDDIGEPAGRRMDDLTVRLRVHQLPDTDDHSRDIDTPDDARRQGFSLSAPTVQGSS